MNDKITHAKIAIGKTILNAIDNNNVQLWKKDVAKKSGVSKTSFYSVIDGKGAYTIDSLIRVCIAADVDLLSLLNEIEYQEIPQIEKDEIIKVLEAIKNMTHEAGMNVSMINDKVCTLIDKYL